MQQRARIEGFRIGPDKRVAPALKPRQGLTHLFNQPRLAHGEQDGRFRVSLDLVVRGRVAHVRELDGPDQRAAALVDRRAATDEGQLRAVHDRGQPAAVHDHTRRCIDRTRLQHARDRHQRPLTNILSQDLANR